MRRDEGGAASVELAVAFPLLLLVLFGMIQILFLVSIKTVLDHAAYESVRTGMVAGDFTRAKKRALRVTGALPYGAGFLGGKTKVRLARKGGSISAEVKAKILLLPFIRQVSLVAGGDGTIAMTGKAKRRIEPYLGY